MPAGPVTFKVTNGGTAKVTEFELKNDDGIILGERENIVEGIDGSFTSPSSRARTCSAARTATGRTTASSPSPASADRAPPRVSAAAAAARRRPATTPTSSRQSAKLLAGTQDVRRGARSRRPRGGEEPVRAGPRVTTSASSRSPRASATSTPRSTRASTTSPNADELDRLPPHRADPLGQRTRPTGTAPYAREAARGRDDAATRRCRRSTFQPRAARERRRRAAERGRRLEDHRRGGPLLAHRPLRLPGQRRRCARGVRAAAAGARRSAGTARSRRRSTRASPPSQKGLDRYRRDDAARLRALRRADAPSDRKTLAQAVDALAEPLSTVAAKVHRLSRQPPTAARGRRAGGALGLAARRGRGYAARARARRGRRGDRRSCRSTARTRRASRRRRRTGSCSPRSTSRSTTAAELRDLLRSLDATRPRR